MELRQQLAAYLYTSVTHASRPINVVSSRYNKPSIANVHVRALCYNIREAHVGSDGMLKWGGWRAQLEHGRARKTRSHGAKPPHLPSHSVLRPLNTQHDNRPLAVSNSGHSRSECEPHVQGARQVHQRRSSCILLSYQQGLCRHYDVHLSIEYSHDAPESWKRWHRTKS